MSILGLLVIASLLLSACGTGGSGTGAGSTSGRKGAWVDSVVFTSVDEAPNAVAQIQAGALDTYSYSVSDPDVFKTVKDDPNLTYSMSYGSFDSLMFNNAGPTFSDGRLNPFSNKKIREAVNMMIDRDYVVQEAVGGLGAPKWVVLIQAYPDYALYADIIRPLEQKYAYNLEKADQIISAEMEGMGATKVDGKWTFNDQPVVIIGLIRTEDERRTIGNYFADQLEKIGFTVDRQERTRNELAPIWQQGDPTAGEWHWYTGGNGYQAIARNAGSFFRDFFTSQVASTTAEEAFTPSPEFEEICTRLANNDYASMEERRELFAKALPMSLEDSQYVFVLATYDFFPRNSKLELASDLGGGVYGAALWPYTVRWSGQEGGTVRSAEAGILTGPWNAIAGQNWFQETMLQKASMDDAVISDPYTGLAWPQRLEKAEVQAINGTPMTKTLDWVDLKFVDKIDVPADAWVDWDAKAQKFITAGEKWPDGMTARTKTTVYYPKDLWKIKWHDGSPMAVSDFVNYIITTFDNAKPDSAVYDESAVSGVDALLTHFKGVRIVSKDPLVIETYDDLADLDAEVQVTYYTIKWFPVTPYGPLSWAAYVPGYLAESNRELAFSASKSTELGVDWTNYVDGPSLDILKKYLDQAQAENFIPFEPTLGQYITKDEAKARYANLQAWYEKYHHFWIGTGPFYMEQFNSVEGSVVAKRNLGFPDPADKWSRFGTPKFAVVDVAGPAQVTAGQEATFDISVTFNGTPYAKADISRVNYLLYDSGGNVVATGEAEFVSDGKYKVTLTAEQTGKLPAGASKIEIIVAPNVVSIATFVFKDFMAAGQ
jgi:peptide/nickel transport system substrate-binding protein